MFQLYFTFFSLSTNELLEYMLQAKQVMSEKNIEANTMKWIVSYCFVHFLNATFLGIQVFLYCEG